MQNLTSHSLSSLVPEQLFFFAPQLSAFKDDRLCRSDLANWQAEEERESNARESDFMKAFKVAHFTMAEDVDPPAPSEAEASGEANRQTPQEPAEEAPAPTPAPAPSPEPLPLPEATLEAPVRSDKRFWDALLARGYEELQAQQAEALGKGKRERKQVRALRGRQPILSCFSMCLQALLQAPGAGMAAMQHGLVGAMQLCAFACMQSMHHLHNPLCYLQDAAYLRLSCLLSDSSVAARVLLIVLLHSTPNRSTNPC